MLIYVLITKTSQTHARYIKNVANLTNMNDSTKSNGAIFPATCRDVVETWYLVIVMASKIPVRSRIAILAINSVLMFSALLLNSVSIITIQRASMLKNKLSYFLILVQSVMDCLVGVVSIPLFIIYLATPFLGIQNCMAIILTFQGTLLPTGLSIITLSAMIIERYIGVIHPYYYQSITKRQIVTYISCFALLLVFVTALSYHVPNILRVFVPAILLPFFVFTGFVYINIYIVVRKLDHSEIRHAEHEERTRRKALLREVKRANSCFLVVFCFAIFLLPIALSPIFTSLPAFNSRVYILTVTLSNLNSSINSVIFFWTKRLLRNEARRVLRSVCLRLP